MSERQCDLAAEGVNLVLVAQTEEKLAKAVSALKYLYDVGGHVPADLGEMRGREAVLSRCSDPDILIHNGGWPRTPEEFASLCVFLCSAHSGFITGQHILNDGAGYPGVF